MFRHIRNSVCGVLLAATILSAAETPIPPKPNRWVTDTVGFMTPGSADQLDARLQAYEQQTHHQLIVWIGKTTGDATLDEWAVRAFKEWGIGRAGINDGLALFIMAEDRKLRIEVGYDLEGQVPDILANRIIQNVITPQLRSGDTGGAITAGMEAIAAAIGEGPLPGAGFRDNSRGQRRPMSIFQIIVFAIFGIIVLAIFITNPSLMLMLLAGNMMGGGRRRGGWGGGGGGFGGGGGGFSGGGGYSGGGGASGSW